MKISHFMISLSLLFVLGCGKSDDSSPNDDYGYGKVMAQESVLKNQHLYQFQTSQADLKNFNCDEKFIDNSIVYLEVANAYTKKAIDKKDYDNDKTKNVVNHYNQLMQDLGVVFDNWDSSCQTDEELPVESVAYKTALQGKTSKDLVTNNLLKSLEILPKYKTALDRLLIAIENNKTPNMEDVYTLHLYQQVLYSKETYINENDVNSFQAHLDQISNSLPADSNNKSLGEFKQAYEDIIESKLGKTILYNKGYYSVPSKVLKGKTQCLGGTKTDLMLNLLTKGAEEYYQNRPVVILAKGHILPGFLIGAENEWHLFGVETVYTGNSEIYYGNLEDINELSNPILVADAFDYLYLNAVQHYLEDSQMMTKAVFKSFYDKYQIPNFQDHYDEVFKKVLSSNSSLFKKDIFSFGDSNQEAGTFKRSKGLYAAKSSITNKSTSEIINSIKQSLSKKKLGSKISKLRKKFEKFSYLSLPANNKNNGGLNIDIGKQIPSSEIYQGEYICNSMQSHHQYMIMKRFQSFYLLHPEDKNDPITFYPQGEYEVVATSKNKTFKASGYFYSQSSHGFNALISIYENSSLVEQMNLDCSPSM